MDWTDPTGAVRTTTPVDHLGTTLPTATAVPGDHRNNWVRSSPSDTDGDASFGDVVWDGDYWNPDAYAGGIALWLEQHHLFTAMRQDIEFWSPPCFAHGEEPTPPAWLDDEAQTGSNAR
jgi:hypothetical protein